MNCDRIARAYRWMEYATFGVALERRRRHFLHDIRSARRVLVLGDGDGRFTAEFLRHNPEALVEYVEISKEMTAVARARFARQTGEPDRVRHLIADARCVPLSGPYDLVVTHFFLDCFTSADLEALIPRIRAHLSPGGSWLVSEFQIPTGYLRHLLGLLLIRALYCSFRLLTGLETGQLPDYRSVLRTNHFRLRSRRDASGGLLTSELWDRGA